MFVYDKQTQLFKSDYENIANFLEIHEKKDSYCQLYWRTVRPTGVAERYMENSRYCLKCIGEIDGEMRYTMAIVSIS